VRAALGLAGLGIALLALGSAQGWGLLHVLSYALFLTLGLSYLWSLGSVRALYVRPRPRLLRAEVGRSLEERPEIESLNWLPRPWLEVIDAGDHPDHNLSEVIALGPRGRRARIVRTVCQQRGLFSLGPLSLASGDPFGLFRRERRIQPATQLIVLPATVPLPGLGQLPGELPGGSLQGERVHFTTANVATVREYQAGDSYSRVHWPSTARLGRLMVKEFERDPFSDLWIVLDLDRLVQAGSGPESTEEYGVTVAASLGCHYLAEQRAVGIISQAGSLLADRGARQLIRLLEYLALLRGRREPPLDQLLLANSQRFRRRDSLVIVTPTSDHRWVSACRDLAGRGVRASAVLLEATSFDARPASGGLLNAVGAVGLPTYRVRRGDDLAAALASPLAGQR
jgi:uncharacterized protein (DUF58 family)